MRWWHINEVGRLERTIFGVDSWNPELFWSELAQGRARHYLVATDGGVVVGYCGLAISDTESYIQTIAVSQAARRTGVGTRMILALLRHARLAGARTCGLEVRTDNVGARSIYARLGFVDIGYRRGYYQPSGADAYVMEVRDIGNPAYGQRLAAIERAVTK
jgi:[ribosomal protein S18]-alanine N-acetyltransferase